MRRWCCYYLGSFRTKVCQVSAHLEIWPHPVTMKPCVLKLGLCSWVCADSVSQFMTNPIPDHLTYISPSLVHFNYQSFSFFVQIQPGGARGLGCHFRTGLIYKSGPVTIWVEIGLSDRKPKPGLAIPNKEFL